MATRRPAIPGGRWRPPWQRRIATPGGRDHHQPDQRNHEQPRMSIMRLLPSSGAEGKRIHSQADLGEAGRRLMAAQACLVLGEIDDIVAAVADLRAGRGDVQRKELPAVGFWELLTRMLHHGFERNQLEDGADGILHVRDAIPEDAHRLRQLLGIRVPDARVPDLGPVEDAPKGLLGYGDVSRGRDGYRPEGQSNDEQAPFEHTPSFFREVATLVRADDRSRSSHHGLPRISLVISRQSPGWRGSPRRTLPR